MRGFENLDVGLVQAYRAQPATRLSQHGRPLQPKTILESHRAILCLLRWAKREGYSIDERILDLVAPCVPLKEPTIYHIAQLRSAGCLQPDTQLWRWDAGSKGRRSRRMPITRKMAAAVKRGEARHRRETDAPNLLIRALRGRLDQGDDGSPPAPDELPCARARVPAHIRDGGHQAGLDLRAPLRARDAPTLRVAGHRT